MKARSALAITLLISFSLVISHSVIAGDGFTQNFYGPTKIIKKGDQLPEIEDKGFDQHFYGETTNIDKKDAIIVDIKSIPDWVLIKEVKKRGLLIPALSQCNRPYKFFNLCTEELCY